VRAGADDVLFRGWVAGRRGGAFLAVAALKISSTLTFPQRNWRMRASLRQGQP